ncbi:hypothetical protein ILYODFUR_012184 [Ilyodon furcidens]|uniref:Uncharacterized protein n=1 Tax=Ilyodon furcidens TaxID=33524 RepID=A0ABV0SYZ1_9TELE
MIDRSVTGSSSTVVCRPALKSLWWYPGPVLESFYPATFRSLLLPRIRRLDQHPVLQFCRGLITRRSFDSGAGDGMHLKAAGLDLDNPVLVFSTQNNSDAPPQLDFRNPDKCGKLSPGWTSVEPLM